MYEVQHVDKNASLKDYKHLQHDEFLVTSIFYTIQGEGPHAGTPAIFIRLAGCNRGAKIGMGCEFCDTDFRLSEAQRMTWATIHDEMEAQMKTQRLPGLVPPLCIITGGEPMMQDNLPLLVDRLRTYNYPVQIESNGDRIIPGIASNADPKVSLVISPKVVRNGYKSLSMEVLARVNAVKLLVDARPSSPYYNLPIYAKSIHRSILWLSPLTIYRRAYAYGEVPSIWNPALIDYEKTKANYEHAADLAMTLGCRLSLQTHLFLNVE